MSQAGRQPAALRLRQPRRRQLHLVHDPPWNNGTQYIIADCNNGGNYSNCTVESSDQGVYSNPVGDVAAEEWYGCGLHIFGASNNQQQVGVSGSFVPGTPAEMRISMSKRRAYIAAAVAAGILAAGGAILAFSGAQAGTQPTAVTSTTTIPDTDETWAPPPAAAAPALTADQAWAKFTSDAGSATAITPDMTVQLGTITQEVGPYCGTECDMWTTVNGISYRALNELAYGYYWSSCQNGTNLPETACENWFFVDANTGNLITGALPRLGPAGPSATSSSPSATSPG